MDDGADGWMDGSCGNLPARLMFMHVEEVKALVISSLQRLVVQCQVPT
jgi:hypothetical protein